MDKIKKDKLEEKGFKVTTTSLITEELKAIDERSIPEAFGRQTLGSDIVARSKRTGEPINIPFREYKDNLDVGFGKGDCLGKEELEQKYTKEDYMEVLRKWSQGVKLEFRLDDMETGNSYTTDSKDAPFKYGDISVEEVQSQLEYQRKLREQILEDIRNDEGSIIKEIVEDK